MNKILVLIMLSLITQFFSGSSQANVKTYPRQINLSGNVFHFSLPEDFSKDMPAYDMVEALDISDPQKFDDPEYGNLIRRWWDIKEPGWFGKNLGTVMMDISVQRVVENKQQLLHSNPYHIKNRMDFMLMLDDSFHQNYDALNKRSHQSMAIIKPITQALSLCREERSYPCIEILFLMNKSGSKVGWLLQGGS